MDEGCTELQNTLISISPFLAPVIPRLRTQENFLSQPQAFSQMLWSLQEEGEEAGGEVVSLRTAIHTLGSDRPKTWAMTGGFRGDSGIKVWACLSWVLPLLPAPSHPQATEWCVFGFANKQNHK